MSQKEYPRGKPGRTCLKSWIYEEGLNIYDSGHDKREPTHLMMDGGKFCIPPKRMNEFCIMYAGSALFRGERNYVSENRTNIFKFLVDLDFFGNHAIDYDTEIVKYIKSIQDVLTQLLRTSNNEELSPTLAKVIVLITENSEKIKGGVPGIKTGIHLIWPNIYVNPEIALTLRDAILTYFLRTYKERMGTSENAWCDVIDKNVYVSSGLRMIGSRKCEKCNVCQGKGFIMYEDDECKECLGWKKIDVGRVYTLKDVFDGNGQKNTVTKYMKSLVNSKPFCVNETSIRTQKEFPNVSIVSVYPQWFNGQSAEIFIKPPNKKSQKPKKEYPFGAHRTLADRIGLEVKESGEFVKLDRDLDVRYDKIVYFIRNTFPDVYRTVMIGDILEFGTMGKSCHRYVARANEHFCLNIHAHHTSNTIYFVIRPGGAVQKCFSLGNNPNRIYRYGSCEKYESAQRPLTKALQILLFGKPMNGHTATSHRNNADSSRFIKKASLREDFDKMQAFLKRVEDSLLRNREYEDREFNMTNTGKRKMKRKRAAEARKI